MLLCKVILSLYCFFLVLLWAGWRKALRLKRKLPDDIQHFISVVIPVRNEAKTIGKLLESIQHQRYKNFEIIIIDDHSEDELYTALKNSAATNLRIIPSEGVGKKKALTTGVNSAKGTIIATTDGDCTVGSGWLGTINRTFQEPAIHFAFGGVSILQNGKFFPDLQAIEFSSLIGTAASTAEFNAPTMCNGANLAYRKNIFLEVKGYESNENIPSGDDEFLMRKILQKYFNSVSFMGDEDAVVRTEPQNSLNAFFQQRFRWAAKWRFNSFWFPKLLAVFILTSNLAFIVSLVFLSEFNYTLLFLLLGKVMLEAFFLSQVVRFLGNRWNWLAFLFLQISYPFYVVVSGIVSSFVNISWKGRKIQ